MLLKNPAQDAPLVNGDTAGGESGITVVNSVLSGDSNVAGPTQPTEVLVPNANWLVGFAVEDVSPSKSLILGGYGSYTIFGPTPRKGTEGVHDPLLASAMAISRGSAEEILVIVGLDAVGLPRDDTITIRNRVAEAFPEMRVSVVVASSHTHHAPDMVGLWGALPLSGRDNDYVARVRDGIVAAAIGAVKSRMPAILRVGEGKHNNSSSEKDDEFSRQDQLAILEARSVESQEVLGTLTQWSSHPTVLRENNNAVSADFVGAYRHFLQKKITGTHVFINGVLGNVYPIVTESDARDPFTGQRDPDVGEDYDRVAAVGQALAASAAALLETGQLLGDKELKVCQMDVDVSFTNLKLQSALFIGTVNRDQVAGGTMRSEIGMVKIGDLSLGFVPGEILAGVSKQIRVQLRIWGGPGQQMIVGMASDWIGYIMTRDEYGAEENKYFADLSFDRKAGEDIVGAFSRIAAATDSTGLCR